MCKCCYFSFPGELVGQEINPYVQALSWLIVIEITHNKIIAGFMRQTNIMEKIRYTTNFQ
jgi:hypothetical protein